MRIYAERPGRAALQVLADVAVLVWVVVVVDLARTAQALLLALQVPAGRLTGAGESLRGAFDNAATTASGVPFVGDDLARALGTGTGAGDSLAAAGNQQVEAIATFAFGTAVDTDLLALRAITRRPVRRLLRVAPDPAGSWRRDDREVVRELAALELRSL